MDDFLSCWVDYSTVAPAGIERFVQSIGCAAQCVAGVPFGWVAADEVYGNNSKLRQWLEQRRLSYVLAVAPDQRLRWPDGKQRRVDQIAHGLPALA
jgi:hypothetical protein